MLESIRLKNFQKHRAIEIEFDPLVTCIVGASGTGKSSILRAIRWVVLNKPSGDSFIRHGKKGTVGELVVDGIKIVRKKGKGDNSYALENNAEGSGNEMGGRSNLRQQKEGREKSEGVQPKLGRSDVPGRRNFKAFGTEPPQAVTKILNIAEDSFARQLDAPYFFSLTPGQAAKDLNQVIDLEVIDRTLGKLAAGQRKARMELEVGRQRYLDAEAKGKELAWVRQMDADLRGVERAEQVYERTKERADALRETIGGAEKVRRDRENAASEAVGSLRVLGIGDAWHKKAKKAADLGQLLFRLEKLEGERCEVGEKLKGLGKLISRFSHCPVCQQPMPS